MVGEEVHQTLVEEGVLHILQGIVGALQGSLVVRQGWDTVA